MTNETRLELLRTLDELGQLMPDVRFGQLIADLSYLARGPANESIWDAEDEELLTAARKLLDTHRARAGFAV